MAVLPARLPRQRSDFRGLARAGLLVLVSAPLLDWASRTRCMATAKEGSEWVTFNAQGDEAFRQAETMLEDSRKQFEKLESTSEDGKLTEAQGKAFAEGWALLSKSKSHYVNAEASFKKAKTAFTKELNDVTKEARKKSIDVPEDLEKPATHLEEKILFVRERLSAGGKTLTPREKAVGK
mmetsp:Transcript_57444/g.115085  ORF Transcript_57444/g.115085 Transcript_57444/m.115085 type:complete len:180 (-) Transcript_57444:41-580(-)